jgi:hypothetical protein
MNTPQIIVALTRAFHQPAIVANPCEVAACSVCGRTFAWCTCIGTYAFPRPSEREQQRPGDVNPEISRSFPRAGSVEHHHGSASK